MKVKMDTSNSGLKILKAAQGQKSPTKTAETKASQVPRKGK